MLEQQGEVLWEDLNAARALLTQENLDAYGAALKKVFPVQETPCFTELLRLIDQADRENRREQDRRRVLQTLREPAA